jgi:tight adherence protein C
MLAGAAVVAVLAFAAPLAAVVMLAALAVWPKLRRAKQRRRAADDIVRALPELADLLVLATGAGLTPLLALRRVQPFVPGPFRKALAEVLGRVDRGERLADALGRLPALTSEASRPIVSALTATERYGTPLGPALDLLAHEARQQRRRQAELAARRLPVRMAFPLVGCILPAFVLLTVAPLAAGTLASLRS